MSMLQDFKAFAMRGNVVDLAVGVIIGAAFGRIVTSLVNDIIMPPIGVILGDVDFSRFMFTLRPAVGTIPAVQIRYGVFINNIVDFLIVAAAVFLLVQGLAKLYRKEPEPAKPPVPTREETLLTEIRDILRESSQH